MSSEKEIICLRTAKYARAIRHNQPTKWPPRYKYRRLTPEQVARIRAPKANITALAREFGVSKPAVFYIRHRYSYKDLP